MKRIQQLSIAVLFIGMMAFTTDTLPKEFTDLLNRAQLEYKATEGFAATKIIANRQMNYEYAIKHSKKNFEVRYAVRPLDQLIKEYNEREKNKKPGDVNLHPNILYKSLLQATALNISGGKPSEIGPFDKQAVKTEFNADWGATSFVEVGKEFGQDYKYCMIVALHRNDVADAYYFYLSDTKDGFQDMMLQAFHSMKFK